MATCSPSLKYRIVRSSNLKSHHPFLASTSGRPHSYRHWSEEKLYQACKEVQEGKSIRHAAQSFGIPKSTLHDRVSGKVMFGARSGPTAYLTEEEEDELVAFLTGCASIGYARSKKQVIAMVQSVMHSKGLDKPVTDGWWRSFLKRHDNLTLQTAEPLAYVRAISSQPEILERYCDLLEQTMQEHDLLDKPCQIFNLDETGMPLDPSPPKVVCPKGVKHATSITTGNKAQITVLCCCNAAGHAIPPLVVFDRQSLKPEMSRGEVPGTMYGFSKNGWMDMELFEQWFMHHFLAYAPSLRPLLLIMDGHSTHFQPYVVRLAAKEDVILFCLPPHTTHITQPLDKGCFGPLKAAWKDECKEYLTKNPGKIVTRYEFSQLFGRAWIRSITMKNITAGFRTTGIYPFNRYAIIPAPSPASKFDPKSLCTGTKIKFLPLYSPSYKSHPSGNVQLASPQLVAAPISFSEEEISLFSRRYEEGYDLTHDQRYNLWLKQYHPKCCSSNESSPRKQLSFPDNCDNVPDNCDTPDNCDNGDKIILDNEAPGPGPTNPPVMPLQKSTIFSKILEQSQLQVQKLPQRVPKSSARVLTSSENIKIIEEKEKKKKAKELLKLERKAQRELKKMAASTKQRRFSQLFLAALI